MDLIEHILFLLGAIYFILAERGIIKLPSQKRQQEFDDRMKIKTKKYLWLTLAYAVLCFSVFLIVKDLYFHKV